MKAAALFTLLSALGASAAPAAATGSKAFSSLGEAATHFLGNPSVLTGMLSDLAKPWYTDGAVRKMSSEELQEWRPLAELVAASYCPLDKVSAMTCGPACDDISRRNVTILGTGGDNQSNPQWLVADDGERLIVVLEGTNAFSVLSWLNDFDFVPLTPGSAHFPDNNGAKLHRGMYSTFLRQIYEIEAVMQPHLDKRKKITVTGHSQGAALGEVATTYLSLQHKDHEVTGRVFAKPRIGDRRWADYVDTVNQGRFQYMQNNADIVGMIMPIEWAFRHPSGEVWIHGPDTFQCDGQENRKCLDSQKAVGWVPNLVIPTNELQAHIGPYLGVQMGLCGVY